MSKFEYRTYQTPADTTPDTVSADLTDLGLDGWEVIDCITFRLASPPHSVPGVIMPVWVRYTLERSIAEDEDPLELDKRLQRYRQQKIATVARRLRAVSERGDATIDTVAADVVDDLMKLDTAVLRDRSTQDILIHRDYYDPLYRAAELVVDAADTPFANSGGIIEFLDKLNDLSNVLSSQEAVFDRE